jgi:hypothetical protein
MTALFILSLISLGFLVFCSILKRVQEKGDMEDFLATIIVLVLYALPVVTLCFFYSRLK